MFGGSRERANAPDVRSFHTLFAEADAYLSFALRTFMTLRKPSWFFRSLVLGAQGVFYNLFCWYSYSSGIHPDLILSLVLSYILSPKTCHRFVGYLEEEAVLT